MTPPLTPLNPPPLTPQNFGLVAQKFTLVMAILVPEPPTSDPARKFLTIRNPGLRALKDFPGPEGFPGPTKLTLAKF